MKSRIPQIRTANQTAQLHREINRQLAEHTRAHEADYIALALWAARETLGLGRERLTRLHAALTAGCRELERHYEMDNGGMYLAKIKLREMGVDVDELVQENQILKYEVSK